MGNDWTLYAIIGATMVILMRLDRLGRQLEAINTDIKVELAPQREEEFMREWKTTRAEEAKQRRQFWIFWGIVGALILAWHFIVKS